MGDFWPCGCADCGSQRQDSDQARQSDFYPTILGASTASEARELPFAFVLPSGPTAEQDRRRSLK